MDIFECKCSVCTKFDTLIKESFHKNMAGGFGASQGVVESNLYRDRKKHRKQCRIYIEARGIKEKNQSKYKFW
ncbi:hypothetical protein AYI70_g7191 [Smittium culicis]|uniref:Uncharacterized protein n=1 Tax=Smittium culicis TaxID=133412 RepID=A0A1R1XLP6_9FUNG|nr:hypothetical protein AYI70_g7191 [Smittium culicis]